MLAVFALPALHGGVLAADLPAPGYTKAPMAHPGINWSGLYAGVNAGYGRGNAPTSLAANDIEANFGAREFNPLPATLRPEGFIGGGQAGYNAQFGSVVAGLEGNGTTAGVSVGWTAGGGIEYALRRTGPSRANISISISAAGR